METSRAAEPETSVLAVPEKSVRVRGAGVGRERRGVVREHDLDLVEGAPKFARDDESVAAVVAGSRKYDDAPAR